MVGNLWELLETCVNFGQLAVCDSHLQSMTVSGSQLITRITRTLQDPILAFSRIFRMVRRHVGSVMVLYFIAYSIHCVQSSERLFLPHHWWHHWHHWWHQRRWMSNHSHYHYYYYELEENFAAAGASSVQKEIVNNAEIKFLLMEKLFLLEWGCPVDYCLCPAMPDLFRQLRTRRSLQRR